jgi:hypothetical protein
MNEPAFPNEGFNGWGEPFQGMTLRDYFAAKAMEALILRGFEEIVSGEDWQKLISHGAFSIADTMMEVRDATQ